MPRLALPATSATHTLSHPLLSFSATLRTYYLPTLRTHVHGNPPISRIASSLVSSPLVLFLPRMETALLLRPFCPLSSSFTLPIFRSRFSPRSSLSVSPFFSLYPTSASLSLCLSLSPLVVSLSPRATPASSLPLIPLTLSREGTLADAPDVSTVRLPLPLSAATDVNGVVTTTDVAFPPPSSATLLGSDLRFSSPCPPPFKWDRANASEGVVDVVVVVVPSFAFKLD